MIEKKMASIQVTTPKGCRRDVWGLTILIIIKSILPEFCAHAGLYIDISEA